MKFRPITIIKYHNSGDEVLQDIAIGSGGLGSNPAPVKLETVPPTARHRCDVSLGCVVHALSPEIGLATRYTISCNTASLQQLFSVS